VEGGERNQRVVWHLETTIGDGSECQYNGKTIRYHVVAEGVNSETNMRGMGFMAHNGRELGRF